MAQQLAANESTSLASPEALHPIMEQQVEGRDHDGMISLSPSSNIITQPSAENATLVSSIASGTRALMQVKHEDGNIPLLHSTSPKSTMEQGRESAPRAVSTSPRVENDSTEALLSGPVYSATEQQHTPIPSALPSSGEPSPNNQHSVRVHSSSNIIAQQAEKKPQQYRRLSLSVLSQSSIMIRRNAHAAAESASAGCTSTSQESVQNLNPQRVRQLISTLGLDDDRSEFIFKLVITTAPFYNPEPESASPAPEESNPQAEALRETLGKLMFAPKSPTAEEGPVADADNSTANPTGNLLFDANAAENLGSRQLEPRSDSPPLLWSTAAVEEPLDPNAEDPTYFTIAEFVNTIIEKSIQVESVTEEDWQIEELRVAILERLNDNILEERLIAPGGSNGVSVSRQELAEEVHAKEDATKSNLKAEGGSNGMPLTKEKTAEEANRKEGTFKVALTAKGDLNEVPVTEKPTGQANPKKDASKSAHTAKGGSTKVSATMKATKQVSSREDTSTADLQRWKDQSPDGWLKRDDGTDMNGDEIEDECARWDAMVKKARSEKAMKMASALLGGEASQKKNKKGSRKNKNKNSKAKKNASKAGDAQNEPEDKGVVEEGDDDGSGSGPMRLRSLDFGEKFDSLAEQIKIMGLTDSNVTVPQTDAPEKALETMSEKVKRKAREAGKEKGEAGEDVVSHNAGVYTPSVYSEHGKELISPANYLLTIPEGNEGRGKSPSRSISSRESNPQLVREILEIVDAIPRGK